MSATTGNRKSSIRVVFLTGIVLLMAGLSQGFAQEPDPEPEPDNNDPTTTLDTFGNEHEGIFQLNQVSGALSSQLNSIALGSAIDGAAFSEALSSQVIANARIEQTGPSINIPAATMHDGLGNASGLLAVNQSSGFAAIQSNSLALAIGQSPGSFASAHAETQSSLSLLSDSFSAIPFQFGQSSISNIGRGTSGVISINQESGLATAQANVIALASVPSGAAQAFAVTAIEPRTEVAEDTEIGEPTPSALLMPAGRVSIIDSFNGASGLVQVSQASGSFNRQSNLLAAAFGGIATANTITDAGLGNISSDPVEPSPEGGADDPGGTDLANSFVGFTGLAQIAQTSGHNNVTNNSLAISVSTLPAGAS